MSKDVSCKRSLRSLSRSRSHCCHPLCLAQVQRAISGTVVTSEFALVPSVTITVASSRGEFKTRSDAEGKFSIRVDGEPISISVSGNNIQPATHAFAEGEPTSDIQLKISYLIPPITETVTIQDDTLTPDLDRRDASVYSETLFSRDDQLLQTLNAGINAGQHEGGGKSLEIRRYGFNLDHGGVGGGLKIVVDNVQQNQGTQGHGQGYLGSLKSLSPELVEDVTIINGPFSAAYGDFSGLGVVQIMQREDLPQTLTARVQGGSFKTFRGFFALSPNWKKISSFIAYEPSYTDGPFDSPLRYRRHNVTGNLTYNFSEHQTAGVRFNLGTNSFFSSGQIPLDLVANGELDRFGFIDPDNGGRVSSGTLGIYYRNEFSSGAIIRADAFVGRSLFDLFSNFTFFLTDPVYGDEIQQHDSRLQEGGTFQYIQPLRIFGQPSVFSAGVNIHKSQVNVGLFPSVGRDPVRKFLAGNVGNPDVVLTSARAKIDNYGAYVQNEVNFFDGHLRLSAGLRVDRFDFNVNGFELRNDRIDLRANESDVAVQPKLAISWSPDDRFPITLYANYGRGISSQDARGIARDPSGPKISTTDFYQTGLSFNSRRVSAVFSSFLIDRSNEQVYIPDDGSVELAGRSRSYGVEGRTEVRANRYITFNAGLTNVIAAFYPGQFTSDGRRIIVDSAPHLVANAGIVLSGYRGFTSSLNWRHISRYRLDGEDPTLKASGNDVVDLAVTKQVSQPVEA